MNSELGVIFVVFELIEQILDCIWNYALSSKFNAFQNSHGISFSCARLSVYKVGAIKSIKYMIN